MLRILIFLLIIASCSSGGNDGSSSIDTIIDTGNNSINTDEQCEQFQDRVFKSDVNLITATY